MKIIRSYFLFCQKFLLITEKILSVIFTGLAFALGLWVVYIQDGVINNDAVLYFEAAKLFAMNEWKEGVILFGWPLYSILIAVLHNLSGLSFELVAQWLAALLFAITTFSFIALIRLAGGNKTTIICGVSLLFSSTYIVGDILGMVVRDHGFWAFFLTSLIFFIRFYREGKLRDAFLWQATCIIAMLFRIEGITFLSLLPFILFANTSLSVKQRSLYFVMANSLNAIIVILLSVIVIYTPSLTLADLGRLKEIWVISNHGLHTIAFHFSEKSTLLGEQVLGPLLDDYGSLGLILTLIGIVLLKTAKTTGWISIALIAMGRRYKASHVKPDTQRIFAMVASLALLNMMTILLLSYVLSGRYIVTLSFILMIFASFGFAALFSAVKVTSLKHPTKKHEKYLLLIAIIILSLSFFKNIAPKGRGYAYEKEAVDWVQQNIPKDTSIFYVSPRARYYAGAPYVKEGYDQWEFTLNAIRNGTIQDYDYLVINTNDRYPEQEAFLKRSLISYKLIKEFPGEKSRKRIMIFAKN